MARDLLATHRGLPKPFFLAKTAKDEEHARGTVKVAKLIRPRILHLSIRKARTFI